jgi:hypothetical protein
VAITFVPPQPAGTAPLVGEIQASIIKVAEMIFFILIISKN